MSVFWTVVGHDSEQYPEVPHPVMDEGDRDCRY